MDDVLLTIVLRLWAGMENPCLTSGAPVVLEIEPRKYLMCDTAYPPIVIKIKHHLNILFTV